MDKPPLTKPARTAGALSPVMVPSSVREPARNPALSAALNRVSSIRDRADLSFSTRGSSYSLWWVSSSCCFLFKYSSRVKGSPLVKAFRTSRNSLKGSFPVYLRRKSSLFVHQRFRASPMLRTNLESIVCCPCASASRASIMAPKAPSSSCPSASERTLTKWEMNSRVTS